MTFFNILLIGIVGDIVIESRGQHPAIEEDKSTITLGFIRDVDLGIGPAPIELLVQPSHHLSWSAVELTVERLKIRQHLIMSVFAVVSDGDARELVADGNVPL